MLPIQLRAFEPVSQKYIMVTKVDPQSNCCSGYFPNSPEKLITIPTLVTLDHSIGELDKRGNEVFIGDILNFYDENNPKIHDLYCLITFNNFFIGHTFSLNSKKEKEEENFIIGIPVNLSTNWEVVGNRRQHRDFMVNFDKEFDTF